MDDDTTAADAAATEETREVETTADVTAEVETPEETTTENEATDTEVAANDTADEEVAETTDDGAEPQDDDSDVDTSEVQDEETETTTLEQRVAEDPARAAKEITKLRSKAAAARYIDSALTDVSEETREAWITLADLYFSENDEDRAEAQATFARLAGVETSAEEAAPTEELSLEDRIKQEFDKRSEALQAEASARQEELETAADVAAVALQVKELGYDAETDPERYAAFWGFVNSQPQGERDLSKAHEQVQAFEQKAFDRKLAEMKAANTGVPVVSGSGSASVTSAREAEQKEKTAVERATEMYKELNGKA